MGSSMVTPRFTLFRWLDTDTDNVKHAHGARFLELDPLLPTLSPEQ
jgi:hypothetical protein